MFIAGILGMAEVSVSWCCCCCDNYCVGVKRCKICKGLCCTFVNDVVNAVLESGELDGDAEVNTVVLVVVLLLCCCRVCVMHWLSSA